MQFTQEMKGRLQEYLSCHELSAGLGTRESACSVAAINLAIDGRLTDETPDCMSEVVASWIRVVQDSTPSAVRNSKGWKALLPLAAGTGRDPVRERERQVLILEWMWDSLALMQPDADKGGYGEAWARMVGERTPEAADAAASEAFAAACFNAGRAAEVASAASAACFYAGCASARASAAATAACRCPEFWAKTDPVGLLEKLVNI